MNYKYASDTQDLYVENPFGMKDKKPRDLKESTLILLLLCKLRVKTPKSVYKDVTAHQQQHT